MTSTLNEICEQLRLNAEQALDGTVLGVREARVLRKAANLIQQQQATIERLSAALEWYAEQVAGCRKLGHIGDPFRHALDADGGKRARAALGKDASNVRSQREGRGQ